MKHARVIVALATIIVLKGFAQTDNNKEIVEEGTKLFKISIASKYATEMAKAKFPLLLTHSASKAAYLANDKVVCVFFGGNKEEVTLSILFDNTMKIETARADTKPRAITAEEKDLLQITHASEAEIKGQFYKKYSNAHFTLLPIMDAKGKRVYVITSSEKQGVITFGNDYLITFSQDNNLISRKAIHKNLMWTETHPKEPGKSTIEAWHTHSAETGSLLTPTDVYCLLTNEKLTKWKKYSTISESFVSVWNCELDKLEVIPKQKWDQLKIQ
jgi:hypothetical protein